MGAINKVPMAPDPIDLTKSCFNDSSGSWPIVQPILNTLRINGYEGFVVGGAVRDMLLGLDPSDVDILTNAGPVIVKRLFSDQKIRQVGRTFEISLINGVEVASCRSEDAQKDFLEADLGMRDFTINSMAWDPFSHALVDPFNGQKDLSDKIIRFTRCPEDRINEDPIRMVRACRFSARYNSDIEPDSLAAIQAHRQEILTRAAGERIRTEIVKAMAMQKPSKFFSQLYHTGLLALIFPSLDRCCDLDGGPHHGETVFEHCLIVGDALPARQPLLRLTGYLHDVGKFDAAQSKNGQLTFPGHETHMDALETDLERLRFSKKDIAYILSLVRAHMRPLNEESTPKAVRRLLAMLADLDLSYQDFLRMRIADKRGNLAKAPYTLAQVRIRLKKIREQLASQTAFSMNDLEISGREIQEILGLAPGPKVGEIKHDLFEKVLEDPALNTASALEKLIRGLK